MATARSDVVARRSQTCVASGSHEAMPRRAGRTQRIQPSVL